MSEDLRDGREGRMKEGGVMRVQKGQGDERKSRRAREDGWRCRDGGEGRGEEEEERVKRGEKNKNMARQSMNGNNMNKDGFVCWMSWTPVCLPTYLADAHACLLACFPCSQLHVFIDVHAITTLQNGLSSMRIQTYRTRCR